MEYMHSAAVGSNPPANIDHHAIYCRKVMRLPILEPNEEFALAKRWRENRDFTARDRLINAYLKLVVTMASKYRRAMPLDDLVSEGTVGLMRAVERFDPDKGFRLATYAMCWIRAALNEHVRRNLSIVKPVTGEKSLVDKSLSETPGDEDEDGNTWQDRLAFDGTETLRIESGNVSQFREHQEALLAEMDFREDLNEVMNNALDARERRIFHGRCLEDKTREELSSEFGVSRERIRQIEVRAFEKVQRAAAILTQGQS
jgi:RNA polymerase sigma-32 factor